MAKTNKPNILSTSYDSNTFHQIFGHIKELFNSNSETLQNQVDWYIKTMNPLRTSK
jgi:hypothetical protein